MSQDRLTEGGRSIVWKAVMDALRLFSRRRGHQSLVLRFVRQDEAWGAHTWRPGEPDDGSSEQEVEALIADIAADVCRRVEEALDKLDPREPVVKSAADRAKRAWAPGAGSVVEGQRRYQEVMKEEREAAKRWGPVRNDVHDHSEMAMMMAEPCRCDQMDSGKTCRHCLEKMAAEQLDELEAAESAAESAMQKAQDELVDYYRRSAESGLKFRARGEVVEAPTYEAVMEGAKALRRYAEQDFAELTPQFRVPPQTAQEWREQMAEASERGDLQVMEFLAAHWPGDSDAE